MIRFFAILKGVVAGLRVVLAATVMIAGLVRAMAGTQGGSTARARLAKAPGRDWPASALEDLIGVPDAAAIVSALP